MRSSDPYQIVMDLQQWVSSHPLSSSIAWITGESQFSRLLGILDLSFWFNIKEEHFMADYINQVVYRNRLRDGFFIESGSYESDQFSVR